MKVSVRLLRREVAPGVECLTLVHEVPGLRGHLLVHAYRVGELLVDAGSPHGAEALAAALAGTPIRHVLLTHHHEDHVGGLPRLVADHPDLTVWAPEATARLLGDPPRIPTYRAFTWGQPLPYTGRLRTYRPGERLEELPMPVTSLDTPGHTPIHATFLVEGRARFAFTGDLYIARHNRLVLNEGDGEALATSQETVAHLDAEWWLGAHHPPWRDPAPYLEEAAWLREEGRRIQATARELGSDDPERIARHLYGPPSPTERFSEGELGTVAFVRSFLTPTRSLRSVRG